MKKILLLTLALMACSASAQNLFWSFNDEQEPMTIAPECDARFDEVRGGVFMPSVEDVYQYGNIFLENQSYEIKRQAPYCFLVAALNGNADAQFKLAQMYNRGDVLPQDDLSAYKWAFISALNGNYFDFRAILNNRRPGGDRWGYSNGTLANSGKFATPTC